MADLTQNTTVNRARTSAMPNVGFPWRLLIISIILLGLTFLVYFGIAYGYVPFLNSQIDKADQQLAALSKQVDPVQQKELTDFYSQLYNIQTLQGGHLYPSKVFDEIEKNVYPTVRLSSLQLGATGGDLRIEGTSPDFQTLVNQLAIFKSDQNVTMVSLESSRQQDIKDGGGVVFAVRISLKPALFASAPASQ